MDKAFNFINKITAKPEAAKSIFQIIQEEGYKFEKHFYATQDHYLNMVLRINCMQGQDIALQRTIPKPVVILQHGLLSSCCEHLMNGQKSLAFRLVDEGYDVWINNSRGNMYSKHHRYLDPSFNREFWNYSFHEMAIYDQPALFKYIED